jgi:hypothetical protein
VHHVFLDRLPIGGFTGRVFLSLIGVKPPEPQLIEEQPAGEEEGGEADLWSALARLFGGLRL